MGTVLVSKVCHYCGGKATTEDHIVPKCDLPRPTARQPAWFRALNVVPACSPCNNWKDDLRSNCHCDQCTKAWGAASAIYNVEPRGYITLPPPHAINEYALITPGYGIIVGIIESTKDLKAVREEHPHLQVKYTSMVARAKIEAWKETHERASS